MERRLKLAQRRIKGVETKARLSTGCEVAVWCLAHLFRGDLVSGLRTWSGPIGAGPRLALGDPFGLRLRAWGASLVPQSRT